MSSIGIYSCAKNNISMEVVDLQRRVFSLYGLSIQQDIVDCSHGDYLNQVLNSTTKDYVIFFDIDCIPLSADFYPIIKSDMENGLLSGAIGCANHLNPHEVYVHPCFMGFSMQLYNTCGRPDLRNTHIHDTAQSFTKQCIDANQSVKYWEISDGGDGAWNMSPRNIRFGHGTVYENMIYHQYESRIEQYQHAFIKKCKSILAV
jgi:hypothetical protein